MLPSYHTWQNHGSLSPHPPKMLSAVALVEPNALVVCPLPAKALEPNKYKLIRNHDKPISCRNISNLIG